jgi:hypothetical protein
MQAPAERSSYAARANTLPTWRPAHRFVELRVRDAIRLTARHGVGRVRRRVNSPRLVDNPVLPSGDSRQNVLVLRRREFTGHRVSGRGRVCLGRLRRGRCDLPSDDPRGRGDYCREVPCAGRRAVGRREGVAIGRTATGRGGVAHAPTSGGAWPDVPQRRTLPPGWAPK